MNTAIVKPKVDTSNIIQLKLVNGKLAEKPKVRYNKDGSIDKRQPHKEAGISSEVYAFNTEKEIENMINIFDKHINEATDGNKKQIACRNKMMFLIGINISLRASDLVKLKWNFFLKDNGEFKESYILQPKKQRKQGKFVKLYFNKAIKKAVMDYVDKYPVVNIDDYIFQSRKGNNPITEISLWRIIKETAKEAGIEKNIGSHSLRKTFGFWAFHNAEDKNKALVTLQLLFNHSSTQTTLRYIGLLDNEIADMFYSVDLGLDFL